MGGMGSGISMVGRTFLSAILQSTGMRVRLPMPPTFQPGPQMRVFSYNILDGGEGRADPLAEVIEAQRADCVALIEADNSDVLERISKRLKMDLIVAQGTRHAVALLSRLPIVYTINHGAL